MRIDPLLLEKQRACYRLAGAILLVLVAIIVLPKLLNAPSQPDMSEIEIRVATPTAASDSSSHSIPTASSASFAEYIPGVNTAAQPKTASRSYFAVQAGVFTCAQDARTQLARLKKAKLPAYLEREKQGHGRSRFLVRVGPFSDRKQAEITLKQLRTTGLATSQVETQ